MALPDLLRNYPSSVRDTVEGLLSLWTLHRINVTNEEVPVPTNNVTTDDAHEEQPSPPSTSDNEDLNAYNCQPSSSGNLSTFNRGATNKENKRIRRNSNVNKVGGKMVPIGNGHAKLPLEVLENINWSSSYTRITRKLLTAVFSRR
ncbi:uncharacterized protein LOC128202067 [Galleria mellonella]|uniref:Uncharacterized protein LOC128202067 n=1 Tax=Galleria mellonella TaxID=7137 RepID=A0ABM3N058_GALME|nr:uncharacterized protein LOC128202067 [Galleria mellonella]